MTAPTDELAELMPHAPPMRLIDRIVAWEKDAIEVAAEVREQSPYATSEGLEAVALLEYLGQAAAALAGLQARAAGRAPGQGYLVGCREAAFFREQLSVGTELTLHARLEARSKALVHFECEAQVGAEQVATAKLSVFTGPVGARGGPA